jgi:anhydro-N-acetylmuramic acid kinase
VQSNEPSIRALWLPAARAGPTGQGPAAARSLVGVHVSSGCRRISAALVTARGRGADASVDTIAHRAENATDEAIALYGHIAAGQAPNPGAAATLAAQLAEQQAALVCRLLAATGIAADQPLAIGVYDPGLWDLSGGSRAYQGLCDAARLAERTGLSVVDAFAARDVVHGGLGGPLLAIPLAMQIPQAPVPRALVDLGRTIRMTYLPPGEPRRAGAGRVLAFDVGPGTGLLDRLTSQLSEGHHEFDPGGRLAVQGRQIPELVEHWLTDPYFQRPLPRWHPLGCRHEQELNQTVRMAIDSGWSVRDLLCTACHFVAETLALAVRERLPKIPPIESLILVGGGQNNGMLLRSITQRLPGVQLMSASQFGLTEEALEPAAAALLTLLHVDQTPANSTPLTGTDSPRVLGRLTPGSPAHWNRLLHEMTENRPAVMPLRNAV